MRIGVCLKQVPDTSARLEVGPDGLRPRAAGALPVPNPYDEFALEAALRLRGAAGGGEVVLLTLAAESVEETVFHGLAMGADRAIVLEVPPDLASTPRVTGRLLAGALRDLRVDLVCCGERAVDDDAAQVGPIVAELLGIPQVTGVESAALEDGGKALRVRCRKGGSFHVLSCPLPCVAAFLRGPEVPRYPSMADIFAVGTKPIERRPVPPEAERGLRRISLRSPPEERARTILGGTAREAAEALLDLTGRAVHIP